MEERRRFLQEIKLFADDCMIYAAVFYMWTHTNQWVHISLEQAMHFMQTGVLDFLSCRKYGFLVQSVTNPVRDAAAWTEAALAVCALQHKQLRESTGRPGAEEGVKKAHLSSLVKWSLLTNVSVKQFSVMPRWVPLVGQNPGSTQACCSTRRQTQKSICLSRTCLDFCRKFSEWI